MDNTHLVLHPNDAGVYVFDRQNNFLGKIFRKHIVPKVVKKTAAKAKLSPEQTKQFLANTDKAISTGEFGKRLKRFDTASKVVAIGGAAAGLGALAAPLLAAKGAAAAGAAGAAKGGGILAGIGAGAKKVLGKAKKTVQNIADPEPWLGHNTDKTTAGQALDALKNIAKEKAPELLQGLKEKGLQKVSEIIANNQTSPELLPKTRPQKQMEAQVINGGATPIAALDSLMKNPLVIVAIILLIIAVVFSMVKRNG